MLRLALTLALVACGSHPVHTVSLVNRTDRVIEEVYIFPTGAADHGASRARLAPNASTDVSVRAGNIDVLAISAKIQIDDHTRERRTATQSLELRGPMQLVFHDSNQTPAGLDRPNTLGVMFRVQK